VATGGFLADGVPPRLLGGLADDLAQRAEQFPELSALASRLLQALEQGSKLSPRHLVPDDDRVMGQFVDAALDAKAFSIELERSRIAVGHRWFNLVARKCLTFGHRGGERPDPFQQFPVVGHQEPIICRRTGRGLWAERPILPVLWS